MTDFTPDERLSADSLPLSQTEMSLLRVSRDARFPWLILIPQRDGLADLVDLSPDDEARVMADVRAASQVLRQVTKCDKLNVASLGNMVRQLHVHIVARFEGDLLGLARFGVWVKQNRWTLCLIGRWMYAPVLGGRHEQRRRPFRQPATRRTCRQNRLLRWPHRPSR